MNFYGCETCSYRVESAAEDIEVCPECGGRLERTTVPLTVGGLQPAPGTPAWQLKPVRWLVTFSRPLRGREIFVLLRAGKLPARELVIAAGRGGHPVASLAMPYGYAREWATNLDAQLPVQLTLQSQGVDGEWEARPLTKHC